MSNPGSGALVLVNASAGVTLISDSSPLTRLNYFDGKFLRAEDLQAEQTYLRRLVQMSNKAQGAGVVHGFEVTKVSGDKLRLAPGLALDNEGRTLFLNDAADVPVTTLLAQAAKAAATAGSATFAACEAVSTETSVEPVPGASLYLLGISLAEALCGHEDVFGQLCQQACVTDTARPYRVEGVALQARPLVLKTPLPTSSAVALAEQHLRSRVASAYFADERTAAGSLISGAGLASSIWCSGAPDVGGGFVPLGVLAWSGQTIRFLDLWTARRERGAPHPVRYWQGRIAMRPWDVFIAQVLQFQCQLRDSWDLGAAGDDPCADEKSLLTEAAEVMSELEAFYRSASERLAAASAATGPEQPAGGTARFGVLLSKLKKAKDGFTLTPNGRVLINKGIVELPPGGYLPVAPGANLTVNEQVRRLMGEGVDLRFCVVRPDYIPHALETVQHMDRISLLKGLDDPSALEEVDILVPDGLIEGQARTAAIAWEGRISRQRAEGSVMGEDAAEGGLNVRATMGRAATPTQRGVMAGAARTEAAPTGEVSFFYAGLLEQPSQTEAINNLRTWARANDAGAEMTMRRVLNPEAEAAAEPAPGGATTTRARTAAPDPSAIEANFARLRAGALAYRADIASRAARPGAAAAKPFAGVEDDTIDHTAAWIGARLDRDPSSVAEQTEIAASLDLTVVAPRRGGATFADLAFNGKLVVEGRRTAGGRDVVQGRLVGNAVVRMQVSDVSSGQKVLAVNAPVVATRSGGEFGISLDLSSVGDEELGIFGVTGLRARVRITEGAVDALAELSTGESRTPAILVAQLRRNDEAIKPGNALRAASETAIDVIATQEPGSGFSADAQKDLFGLPDAVGAPLVVRATRDWVMFHRRRDRQCGVDAPRPETGVRRYQVYYTTVKTDAALRNARSSVLAADAGKIVKAGFKPVTVVEYAIGASGVLTPEADLIADLKAAGATSDTLVFGAIGSVGAAQAEGEALARTRLSSLELILGEDGVPDAANNEVLPVLPQLGQGGLDGLVFLVAMAVQDACQDVYIAYNDAYREVIAEIGLKTAITQLPLLRLGEVVFPGGGGEPTPESLDAVGQAFNGGGRVVIGVSYRDANATGANTAALLQQSQKIMEALGGDPARIESRSGKIAEATACGGATVIFALRDQPPPPPEVRKVALVLWPRGQQQARVVDIPYGAAEPEDMAMVEGLMKEAFRLSLRIVEPWAVTEPRLALGKDLNEPIRRLIREMTNDQVQPREIEVINVDRRQLLTNQGVSVDDYDLLVSFRIG